jgi:hypothetical protein
MSGMSGILGANMITIGLRNVQHVIAAAGGPDVVVRSMHSEAE